MGRVLRCAQSAQPPYTLPVWQWHLLPVPSRVEQKKRNPVRTRSLALSASQAMAATGTAVSTAAASLPPRGLRQDPPSSLRKRHCAAVRPLAASPTATSGDAAAVESSPRRQVLVAGAAAAAAFVSRRPNQAALAAEYLPVIDRKAGYSFVYPFGWQEVAVQGQDKVYKDVIEPLESVSINMIQTTKEDIRDLGPPDQVAEALIRKVLAPPTQKTKLIEAKENDIDGRAYYTFEFTAQAPNFTRHALGTITIANGKFYTLATGANERRWDKMKDRLHKIVDSFKIETKV
ncbi:psbP-like protein 1, chloroplastic [Brachypodium distachyon]|nr:psbP-like protein 1, chloroplastic [Brachypodium distachyon]|eukprot:XP_003562167.3 psbP-like protein 1, chloroplastic [Brachypodium distachyon]